MMDAPEESLGERGRGEQAGRRRRRSAGQWRELIWRQQASGESVADFCRRRGLPTSSFYTWRRRLGDEDQGAGGAAGGAGAKTVSASAASRKLEAAASQPAPTMVGSPPASTPGWQASSPPTHFVRLEPVEGDEGVAASASEGVTGGAVAHDTLLEVQFDCGATLRCSAACLGELVRALVQGGGRC